MNALAPRKWVSIEEAASFFSIPKKTIYSLAARGRLPAGSTMKLGRALRLDLSAIEAGLTTARGRAAR